MTTRTHPATALRSARRPTTPLDPTALAVACATAYLEVRAGRRPARQLDPLLTPAVRSQLSAVVTGHRSRRRPCGDISVRRVVVSQCGPGILDVVVVTRDGSSITAVAIRIEYRRYGWVVTALGTPEDTPFLRPRGSA